MGGEGGEANTIGVAVAECYLSVDEKVRQISTRTGAALKRNASPAVTSSRSSDLKHMAPPKLKV
ncbi:Hypothetical protein FKW44_007634 [Caligus rogercresseyi]|uniref:Uncharacterized protein n=1 Tax=Caligus rogercresseyi TaxID=217165 RepID=A0A7T8KF08_CALRO|nr:Hypothetical protein FKW44_007634 [Caligus rogercresseyi]